MIKNIVLLFLITCISGCAATTDPSKGGLFNYNPNAYEKRLAEGREKLFTGEEKNKQENFRVLQLRKDVVHNTTEQDRLGYKINHLNDKIIRIEEQIKRAKATNTGKGKELLRIKTKIVLLQRDLNKIKESAFPEELNAKTKEYETLIQKIEILTQEAEFF